MFLTRLVLAARKFQQWSIAQFAFGLLNLLKLFPADGAMNFADRFARFVGPRTKRHVLTLTNLRNAFPEKSEAEIEAIALESWGNMGRLAAEYVFLDQLFDFDPFTDKVGRVEVSGIPLFVDLRDNPRPFIVFTAHSGNFELLPVAGAAFGLDVTVLFRPPNNPYIAEKVFEFRRARMGHLVPSHAGSSFTLARKLEAGGPVGVLVDQKFHKGFPARCIRLPGNRFRLELEPAMAIPSKADGAVDVDATAQMLNDKVESWVREHPGQWLWYHDRWNIKHQIIT